MKVFDQLAGALGSLKLGRVEERRQRKEKRNEKKALIDNDVTEEQAREGMAEMFRKSVQELENRNTRQLEETQKMQGMTRMGNLNMSQGSSEMAEHKGSNRSRVSEGSARSRILEERTTPRLAEDMTRSGRVAKPARHQRGEVEVLRFLSLKLVSEKCRKKNY